MDVIRSILDNPYLTATAILVGGLIAARLVDLIIVSSIGRWSKKTTTSLDDDALSALHRPIRVSVILVALHYAIERLPLPGESHVTIARVLCTIAIIIWAVALSRVFEVLLRAASSESRFGFIESRTLPVFDNISKIVIFAGAIYVGLVTWRVDPTGWLASAGILGIALGFAARDTLANLFSGLFIIADRPYQIGDYVNLDTGERGKVTHIGLRTTRMLTRDDVEVTIPNAVMASAKITNESGGPWAKERIRIPVSVAYGSDIDEVEKLLEEIGRNHPTTCNDPSARVRFRALGASGLDFELLCWIDEPELRGKVMHELLGRVYKALNEAKIEIPYPKRDVYLHQVDPPESLPSA